MPLEARLSKTPGEHDAGPMVHINLVRRVLRKPVVQHVHLAAVDGHPWGGASDALPFLQVRAFKGAEGGGGYRSQQARALSPHLPPSNHVEAGLAAQASLKHRSLQTPRGWQAEARRSSQRQLRPS